MVKAHK